MKNILNSWVYVLLLAVCALGGCGPRNESGSGSATKEPTKQSYLEKALAAIEKQDWEAAEANLTRHLTTRPDDLQATRLLGNVAAAKGDLDTATELYQSVVDAQDRPEKELLETLAMTAMKAGRPFDTLAVIQSRIEMYPDDVEAKFDLCGLSAMLGMTDLSVEPLRWLLQRQLGDADSLLVLADVQRVEPDVEVCQQAIDTNDRDRRALYGIAKRAGMRSDWRQARELLSQVVERHPNFVPAQALLGRSLVELEDFESVPGWYGQLPTEAQSSAEFLIAAGFWALNQEDPKAAAKAFDKALQVGDPFHPRALVGLERSLHLAGKGKQAALVADQIAKATKLRDAVKTHLERGGDSQIAALDVAEQLAELGRIWEAEGWARMALSLKRDPVRDARKRYIAIRSNLTLQTPWLDSTKLVSSQIDTKGFPEVDWKTSPRVESRLVQHGPNGQLQLIDEAASRKLIHHCEIATRNQEPGHWIYQSSGGGIAAIDFDLDGWVDLACSKLNGVPLRGDSSPNDLFRNLEGMFVPVEVASYLDPGHTHGICVGDYNSDGFPDIFDANYGQNRLWRNNGDGTFSDVTTETGIRQAEWTTSAVLADIDRDGIADLYEVAYCETDKPLTYECRNQTTKQLSTCSPLQFESQPDRVYQGQIDGTFRDVTDQWMDQETPGRGLGVLVGFFDERPGLDLYVANDMTTNHLWSPGLTSESKSFRLQDLGVVRGVGVNSHSLSQASMGMTAGDPDGDGDIDFFLTHFADDHNTYYEQLAPGIWADRSAQSGLAAPSIKMLGFGTEWIDLDNNGSMELVITNGHVDDVGRDDVKYQMPAQLFQQDQSGRWEEVDVKQLGPYFQRDHLGRALISLDVNRDGLMDVGVTHVYEPTGLLVNQSQQVGNWVRFQFKATKTERDAIGATISFQVAGRTIRKQLTAGDGYMCTNQRCIHVGLGPVGEVTDVSVQWPDGTEHTLGDLAANQEYLITEGESQAFRLAAP